MPNKKQSKGKERHKFAIELLIGVMLMLAVFFGATRNDMSVAERKLSRTVNYIKEQCNNYDRLNLASETKSLMRIIQSARQIDHEILEAQEGGSKNVTQEMLKNSAEDAYITGVLLLDAEGNTKSSYVTKWPEENILQNFVKSEAVLDTAKFQEKSYSARINCTDGSYYDFAAVGRKNTEEIIVTYYYTPKAYIQAFTISIDSLLSGYSVEQEGTIVVSRGEKIVASNDKKLEGKSTSEIPILRHIRDNKNGEHLTHIKSEAGSPIRSFGIMGQGRKYYIYAYMPEREVFGSTLQYLMYALIIYASIAAAIHMVRWKTAQSYQEKQIVMQKRYADHLEAQNRQLEDAIKRADEANAAKTSFLSRMSHDIRTPLNGIIGLLKIAEAHPDDQDLIRANRKKMMVSAKHLLSLINDILQMSKLESGEIVLAHEPVNLRKLAEEVISIVEQRAAESGVSLEFDEESRKLKYLNVYGSPLHIRQIFLNIFGNCIKYNKVGGKVTTSSECLENLNGRVTYRWIISDTGIGMKKEFLEHIFDPFSQERSDARSVYNGTGLGMSIVKKLIDQMEGTIEVQSEEGVGSTFIITIPFEIAGEIQVEEKKREREKAETIQGLKILLAEDNELNAEIAEMMLEDEGAVVTIVKDGGQAVETFESDPVGTYDVILMDMMMPVMDGITATKAIRAINREDAKTIPIIAMTANAFEEDAKKCMEAGMNAHLAKPFQMKKVIEVICEYCGNK